MGKEIGVAVCGLGRMGQEHIRNILNSKRADLLWIVGKKSQQVKEEMNLAASCTTYDKISEMFGDKRVRVVLIAGATDDHEWVMKAAFEAGKAVICEKPLTSSVTTSRECYEIAESKGLPLLCAFQRRFEPSFYSMYQKIRSGVNGQIRIVHSISRDPQYPPTSYIAVSGGIFKDSTIHDLDVVCWLVGSKPKSVFAQGSALNPEIGKLGDVDQVAVVITHENGAISVIDNGRRCPFGYDQRVEVLCENGMISVNNKQTELVSVSGTEVTSNPKIFNDPMKRYTDAYINEIEHFLDVLEGKDKLRVSKEDTLQAMRLSELCKQSLDEQRAVPFSF